MFKGQMEGQTDILNPEGNIVGAHNTNKLKHSILQYKASRPRNWWHLCRKYFDAERRTQKQQKQKQKQKASFLKGELHSPNDDLI